MEGTDVIEEHLTMKQKTYRSMFENVTLPFIMSTLQDTVDFVTDDGRKTLEFTNMSEEQTKFLHAMMVFPFKKTLYSMLPGDAHHLARELGRVIDDCPMSVRVSNRKKKDKTRYVEVHKKQSHKKMRKSEEASPNYNVDANYDPRAMFMRALSRPVEACESFHEIDYNSQPKPPPLRPNNAKLNGSGIQWKRAVGGDDAGHAPEVGGTQHQPRPQRRGGKHGKLLEALSVPLDSDKAKKMMEKMGWKGGALGVHGVGITEPIMPALNLVAGAGLGHSPPRSKRERERGGTKNRNPNNRTPADYRMKLLTNLLDFILNKDLTQHNILFNEPICNKEMRFTANALTALNRRSNLGLNAFEEKEICVKLLDLLHSNDRLFVEVDYSDQNRTLTLIKSDRNMRSNRRKRKRNADLDCDISIDSDSDGGSPTAITDDIITEADIDDLMADLRKDSGRLKGKSLRALAIKVASFKAILNFINSEDEKGTISFDQAITKKQQTFLENTITNINRRERAKYSSKIENKLYKEMSRWHDFKLRITFPHRRRLKLEKEFRRKRERTPKDDRNNERSYRKLSDNYDKEENENKSDDNNKSEETNKICDYDISDVASEVSFKDDDVYDIDIVSSDSSESYISDESRPNSVTKVISDNKSDEQNKGKIDSVKSDIKINETVSDTNTKLSQILKVCQLNNLDRKLQDVGNMSVSIDIKMKFNSDIDKEFTKEELLDKIDSCPNVSIDFDIINTKRNYDDLGNLESLSVKRFKDGDNFIYIKISHPHLDMINISEIIQKEIIKSIDKNNLPLLKCLGLHNNSLIYRCDTQSSYKWLENLVLNLDFEPKITFEISDVFNKEKVRVNAKLNTFFEVTSTELLNNIQLFNSGVKVEFWSVLNVKYDVGCMIVSLDIDKASLTYICNENFSLYAGLDVVEFSICFD